jgi:hypothetical protein
MSQENVEIAKAFFAAWTRGTWTPFVSRSALT